VAIVSGDSIQLDQLCLAIELDGGVFRIKRPPPGAQERVPTSPF
jgi:hypothetical protein